MYVQVHGMPKLKTLRRRAMRVWFMGPSIFHCTCLQAALAAGAPAKLAANWILSDLSKHCNVSVSDGQSCEEFWSHIIEH